MFLTCPAAPHTGEGPTPGPGSDTAVLTQNQRAQGQACLWDVSFDQGTYDYYRYQVTNRANDIPPLHAYSRNANLVFYSFATKSSKTLMA